MGAVAGIALPEGNPGAVEGAASRLTQAAGDFAEAARTIRQAENGAAEWHGVAFFTFSDHCGQQSEAARAGSEACRRAAVALRRFASELEDARERVRELQRRGEECLRRIDAAESRAETAALQASAAAHRGLEASLASGPGALAAQAAAAQDAQAARNAQSQALGEAAAARGDLRRLQEEAEQERDRIKQKARATASVVRGAVGNLPSVQFPGAPATAQLQGAGGAGGAGSTMWDTKNEGVPWWNEDAFAAHLNPFHPANDELARYKWFAEQGGGFALDLAKGAMIGYAGALRNRAIQQVPGVRLSYRHVFISGRGGTTLVQSIVMQPTTRTVIDADLLARSGTWGKAGRALPVFGTALGIGTAAWDQWRLDSRNPNLTTTDRVGRSAGVGIYVGGAAAGGAALGTLIFPGVGTLAGAGIGAAGGLLVGAAAVAFEPGKELAAKAGQWTANAAVDTWNWSGDRLDDLGDAVSNIQVPQVRIGLPAPVPVSVGVPDLNVDLPDVPDVDVDLPDVPDVDLPDVPDVDLPDVNPF
jgi:uncharacterized protein YukE